MWVGVALQHLGSAKLAQLFKEYGPNNILKGLYWEPQEYSRNNNRNIPTRVLIFPHIPLYRYLEHGRP